MINYQKELEKIIETLGTDRADIPKLLLHSCCAPCSSYVMEYLREHFEITVLYYNPNISNPQEYEKRKAEQKKLIAIYNEQVDSGCFGDMRSTSNAKLIEIMDVDHEPERFVQIAKGYEDCKEGGERCFRCYRLRLEKTASLAKQNRFDYFATTLTISPLKNAAKLNEIGYELEKELQDKSVHYLPGDFKKKEGYKRSIELSHTFDLYRQDFCGCAYSYAQRLEEKRKLADN